MFAMASDGYGPLKNLRPTRVPLPLPGKGEVRVRVQASALNPADYKVLQGQLKIVHANSRPLMVGYDLSGTIDACGPEVSAFRPGDEVFGFLPYSRSNRQGAFAEAVVVRADEIARKPAAISHVQAATVATSGVAALQALRDLGRLRSGQRVLITGASGGVGAIAVAIASRLGAEVTASGSGRGLELARRSGATHVIDRTAGPVIDRAPGPFDVVLDTVGTARWRDWRKKLKPGGTFVTTLPSMGFFADLIASLFSSRRARFVNVRSRPADLELLARWSTDGLHVQVDHVVPVRDVVGSLTALERGGILGRIGVDVKSGSEA